MDAPDPDPTTHPMSRRTEFVVVATLLFLAALLAWLGPRRPGIVVIVRNRSALTLTGVVLLTNGMEFPVGDLPPDQELETGITALGESSVRIAFSRDGRPRGEFDVGRVRFTGARDGVTEFGGVLEYTVADTAAETAGDVGPAFSWLPSRRPLPAPDH